MPPIPSAHKQLTIQDVTPPPFIILGAKKAKCKQ